MGGIYTAKAIVNGCTSAFSNAVNFIITAINSPELNNDIITGPNPVQDYLAIKYNGNYAKFKFQLLSVSGSVLTEGVFTGSYLLDMRKFSAGLYILQITRNDKREQIHRAIMKQ